MAEITRKQFLKLLVAAGGATALAGFLPGKWVKPIVKVGVLPVHAQASGLTISSFVIDLRVGSVPRARGLASPARVQYNARGTCDYLDVMDEMDDTALIYLTGENDTESTVFIDWEPLGDVGGIGSGDVHSGDLYFYFYLPFAYRDATFYLTVKMNGRTAGPIEGVLERPQ